MHQTLKLTFFTSKCKLHFVQHTWKIFREIGFTRHIVESKIFSQKAIVNEHQTFVAAASEGRSFCDADFHETDYYFEDGLRKVYPYYFTYYATCKQRWIGKNILSVYCNEFGFHPEEIYRERIESGKLRVNSEPVDTSYILKQRDYLTSTVHRHEVPISDSPLKILHLNEDLVVVEKPSSMPIHPGGLYRHNSLLFVLAKEHGIKGPFIPHRLDRLTSGLVIFARTAEKNWEICKQIESRTVDKTYLARVEGNFPDEEVVCDVKLMRVYGKIPFSVVHPAGKKSCTKFQKLSYNGKSSLIICKPVTGRMHQIRVHLQYLGYPVVNDPVYNSEIFSPEKGKGGNFTKSLSVLQDALVEAHRFAKTPMYNNKFNAQTKSQHVESNMKNLADPRYDPQCVYCNTDFYNLDLRDLVMCLHSLKYEGSNWKFESTLPVWAEDNWNES